MAKPNPYRFKDYPMLEQDEPIPVGLIEHELERDPESAMARYSQRRMLIKGVVVYAGPDMFGLPSLELSDTPDGPRDALCVFEMPVDAYQEGDVVTVVGNFIDRVPEYNATFKKCEVVDKE